MNCTHCDRPMRPTRTSVDDHPGTVAEAARGYCTACKSHHDRAGTLQGWMPGDDNRGGPRPGPDMTVLPLIFDPKPWQDNALCAETDPDAWYPEKRGSVREAKAVCMRCDVRSECLEDALSREERFGIWGGLSERERRKLLRGAA